MPWVMLLDKRKRTFLVGLAGIALGPLFVFMAYLTLVGEGSYPKVCTGRRKLGCELFNWLYEVGGTPAVAGFFALFGVMCLIGGVLMVTKRSPVKTHPIHE